MVDCHIHTCFSPDSSELIRDIEVYCMEKGIKTIGIADHYDFRNPDKTFSAGVDFDNYFKSLNKVNEVEILKGIEVGYDHRDQKKILDILKNKNLDYVIFSMHTIDDKNLHDDMFFKRHSIYKDFGKYFERINQMVEENDLFQILGHLDYPLRYKDYVDIDRVYEENNNVIESILKNLISKDIALEINSGGMRYSHGKCNPSNEIIRLYKELGGKYITFGSDAHNKDSIGYEYKNICRILSEIGLEKLYYYKNREAIEYSII